MIDIETASRSIDLVIGLSALVIIAIVFLAWVWIRMSTEENEERIRKALSKAELSAQEQCHRAVIRKGATAFGKEMQMKQIIQSQAEQIQRLTRENKRMQSILERVTR